VDAKVKVGIINLSFNPNPFAASERCSAAVQELTATTYLTSR